MSKILITNGGAHPPEKWAMMTAEQIFDIGSTVAGDRLIQAQKFQLSIAELLMPHHEKVQGDERGKLAADAEHINSGHDVEKYLDQITKEIVALAKGSPWQAHFAKPEVQTATRQVIGNHLATSQHVERLWYADKNPDCAVSQAYKARFGN